MSASEGGGCLTCLYRGECADSCVGYAPDDEERARRDDHEEAAAAAYEEAHMT